MNKYYAGIGARATPEKTLALFTQMAGRLEERGFILRSGAADGADFAFERGVKSEDNNQIFLPWAGFNGSNSLYDAPSTDAFIMAAEFHPAWNRCSSAAKKFHARNCHQILGSNLIEPVLFVVCWTPGGAVTGGTGQALRLAAYHNIAIFNFGNDYHHTMDMLTAIVLGDS